ncbi:MAG: cyclic nucleotide-binding domain-containing protein [Archangiaceae bacterium]|nr:cyclic nucleotide-binding domain-containing protein [Archangiaceae bacterium]
MLDQLMKLPMCKGLSQGEATELASIARESQAKKGTVLFAQGAHGDSILVVLEGQIEVSMSGQTLAQVGEGSVLGEMSLLGEGGKRTATATVLSDARLLEIDAARFQELLKTSHLAALKVVANLAQVMSKRLLAMNEKLIEGNKGKKEELADFQKILSNWSF